MRHTTASRIGTVVVCALFFSLVPSTQAQDEETPLAHMPGVARGDFWDFRVTGDAQGTVQNRIEAIERHADRDGVGHEAFRVHATSDVTTTQRRADVEVEVEEHLEVDKWVRVRDEATIGIEGLITIRQDGQDVKATEVEREYTPPLVESVYPFGVGSAWEVKVTVHTRQGSEEYPPEDSELHVRIEAYEEIRVPAGTFMAYRMNVSFTYEGGHTLRWFAPEACTTVQEERYGKDRSSNGPDVTYVLTDYSCSHVAANDPTYDPDHVTLLARPKSAPTGSDPVVFEEPEQPTQEGVGPGVWVALAVVVGVSLTLIGYGRKRR